MRRGGFFLQKQNVLISDSDTVWLRDPRGFLDEGPFMVADVLVSTDCIDTTADEICNTEYCGWGPPPSTQRNPPRSALRDGWGVDTARQQSCVVDVAGLRLASHVWHAWVWEVGNRHLESRPKIRS